MTTKGDTYGKVLEKIGQPSETWAVDTDFRQFIEEACYPQLIVCFVDIKKDSNRRLFFFEAPFNVEI